VKLVVFGATGGTGQEIVKQGLEAGHEVVAFARRPEAVAIQNARLTVAQGDVLDKAAVARAIAGCDAILSALGTRGGPSALIEGTRNIIAAAGAQGAPRSLWVSSFGVGESLDQMGWFARNVIAGMFLKAALEEKAIQERLIMESGLPWIIARPGGLTDGPRTGQYQSVPSDARVSLNRIQISRADVADFLLKNLTDQKWVGQAVGLVY
jgi:putative NADH-flavin reductase